MAETRAATDAAAKQPLFFPGWTIVAVCFLSMNFAVGIVFTGYTPLITAIEAHFGTSRAVASGGPPIASIAMGIIALFIGSLIQKFSARTVMIGGNLLVITGFILAAFAQDVRVLMVIYGTLIGSGFVAMGIVTCSTLVTRWFNAKRGLALGIINLFPGMVVFPLITTWILVNYDLQTVFLANAGMFALLLPIMLLISDRPEDRGMEPLGGPVQAPRNKDGAPSAPADVTARELLLDPRFWMLSIGIALLTGAANMISSQAMPMMIDAGAAPMAAASAMSIYGLAVAMAAPGFGALIDRIGPLRGLFLEIGIIIVPWILISIAIPQLAMFTALIFIIGIGNGGIVTLHTSTAALLFRPEQFSKVMGMGYFLKMPFLLTSSPAAAWVHDMTGSYKLALAGGVASIILAAVLFAALRLRHARDLARQNN